jgi:hypothetical protein
MSCASKAVNPHRGSGRPRGAVRFKVNVFQLGFSALNRVNVMNVHSARRSM